MFPPTHGGSRKNRIVHPVFTGRVMKRLPMFILLAAITCPVVNGGEQDIKKKERALEQLRKEIDAYEQRIEQSEKKEKVTLERIDNYEKQSNLVHSLLSELMDEEEQQIGRKASREKAKTS